MNNKSDHPDIKRVQIQNKEFILIGTAHISNVSAELVKETIEIENPDCVCLELDKKRYNSLVNSKKWENLNLKVIKFLSMQCSHGRILLAPLSMLIE